MAEDDMPRAQGPGRITRFSRDMGIAHSELLRALPGAIGHRRYTVHQGLITIKDRYGEVELRLCPQRERALGALRLPSTPVVFTFTGHTWEQLQAFMDRFELYIRRGGG
jgi:hypothetical protein